MGPGLRRIALVAVLALAGAGTASCAAGTGSPPASGGKGTVDVTLKDFSIAAAPANVKGGEVTFDVANDGPSTHELAVVRTDLAADALPVSNGEVDEGSIDLVDEAEDIAPSTSTTLRVDLQPGTYVLMCNLPSHYQLGMHAAFTVS